MFSKKAKPRGLLFKLESRCFAGACCFKRCRTGRNEVELHLYLISRAVSFELGKRANEDGKIAIFESDHYTPARGTKINKCNYRILDDVSCVPPGFVPLVEGHPVAVPVAWMSDVLGAFKNKTKTCALKLMFNGFFEPHEVRGKTGAELADTLIGKTLKAYALKNWAMDAKSVVGAFNAKIGTMVRALKRLSSDNL